MEMNGGGKKCLDCLVFLALVCAVNGASSTTCAARSGTRNRAWRRCPFDLAEAATDQGAVEGQQPLTDGAKARCTTVAAGLPKGSMICQPSQQVCSTGHGWVTDDAKCQEAWGGTVECPDGITPKGIFFAYSNGNDPLTVNHFCKNWHSAHDATVTCDGHEEYEDCDQKDTVTGVRVCRRKEFPQGNFTCTKAQATHVHWTGHSTGVMVMKRTRCEGETCTVFKTGRCINVGEPVFSSIVNKYITDLKGETKKWVTKAIQVLDGSKGCPQNFMHKVAAGTITTKYGLCFRKAADAKRGFGNSNSDWCAPESVNGQPVQLPTQWTQRPVNYCFRCGWGIYDDKSKVEKYIAMF